MPGPGTKADRLKKLAKGLKPAGVKQAEKCFNAYEEDEIRYAYLMLPTKTPGQGLGSRVEALISNLPKNKQAQYRADLMKAKFE